MQVLLRLALGGNAKKNRHDYRHDGKDQSNPFVHPWATRPVKGLERYDGGDLHTSTLKSSSFEAGERSSLGHSSIC